jgi:hypothetical protein
VAQNLRATFFHGKSYERILTINGLGYNLGDFFPQTHLVTLPLSPINFNVYIGENKSFPLQVMIALKPG